MFSGVADSPFRERRLSPEEVQKVLKRAAELSLVEPATATSTQALTGAELEARLRELGISESVARRAMQPTPSAVPVTANDRAIRVERVVQVEGMLGPEHFEKLADHISARMSMPGRTSAVGNKLTWSPAGLLLEPSVTVHSRDGYTVIRYVETLANRGQMVVGFGTLAGLSGLLAGALGTSAGVALSKAMEVSSQSGAPMVLGAGILVGVGAAIGSFFGLRRAVARRAERRAAFADALLSELAETVRANLDTTAIKARVEAPRESTTAPETEAHEDAVAEEQEAEQQETEEQEALRTRS